MNQEDHFYLLGGKSIICNISKIQLKDFINRKIPILSKERSFVLVAVVNFLSHVQLFGTPWTAPRHTSLSFTIFSYGLPNFMSW